MTPILHIFPYSNFCEKALWAMELAAIPYHRKEHLPGLHSRAIRALSGQTAVPVLETSNRVIAGSDAIVDWAAQRSNGRFVVTSEDRVWHQKLDPIGAKLRAALFFHILPHPSLAGRILTADKRGFKIFAYRQMMRPMAPKLLSMLERAGETKGAALSEARATADQIVKEARPTGFLSGAQFGAADLAAATIFFPTVSPDQSPSANLVKSAPELKSWRDFWADHPIQDYVNRIYDAHFAT